MGEDAAATTRAAKHHERGNGRANNQSAAAVAGEVAERSQHLNDMAQNFLSGNVSTAIDTQRVLEVKILNALNASSGGGGGGTGGAGIVGTGSPEGVVTAEPGTLYLDDTTPGSVHTWVKVSGSGNTGWEQTL